MRQGFEAWRALQEKRPSPEKGSLEEEVLAVLETQFRPGPFRTPPYRLAPSIIRVDLKNGPSLDVTVNNSLRDAPGVIFVNDEQEAFLKTLLSRFRAERAVFFSDQKPSSGQPPQILEFINEFSFAGYRLLGGMKQWRLEWVVLASLPTSISFQDDLRVRAEVCSEDDTGGSCNFYEKRDGVWVFVQNGRIWSINTGGG
jgi:hypothetical protein